MQNVKRIDCLFFTGMPHLFDPVYVWITFVYVIIHSFNLDQLSSFLFFEQKKYMFLIEILKSVEQKNMRFVFATSIFKLIYQDVNKYYSYLIDTLYGKHTVQSILSFQIFDKSIDILSMLGPSPQKVNFFISFQQKLPYIDINIHISTHH